MRKGLDVLGLDVRTEKGAINQGTQKASRKGWEMDFELEPLEKCSPVDSLILAHWNSDFQNHRMINFYCFSQCMYSDL